MKQLIKTISVYLLGIFLLGASISCSTENGKKETEVGSDAKYIEISKEQFDLAGMEIGSIQLKPFNSETYATGILDAPPNKRAEINVYFGGYVKEVDLLPGQNVEKGDVLFVLEDPSYLEIQSDFLQSKESLRYLESDYQRQMHLREDSISSEKQFLKAEEAYQSAKAKHESMYQKLKLMQIDPDKLSPSNMSSSRTVHSPLSGTISNIYLSLGTYLEPTEKALSIISTDHMHLELKIFEKDLQEIVEGQKIRFKTQSNPSREYSADVYLINKHINPNERSIGIHAHLPEDNPYPDLFPGMYIEAWIEHNTDSLPALNESAVVERNGKSFALLLQEKSDSLYQFEEIELIVGKQKGGFLEIRNTEDLPKNSTFLTNGAFNLIDE